MTGAADDIDICASYSRRDSALVVPLLDALKARGIVVWFDKNIPGGALWEETITRQMRKAKAVVFFASRASLESDRCFDEVSAARTLKRPIIPVLVEKVNIPDDLPDRLVLTLQTRNTIDAYPGADGDPVEGLIRALVGFGIHARTNPDAPPTPAPAVAAPPAQMSSSARRSRWPIWVAGVGLMVAAAAAVYVSGILAPAPQLPSFTAAEWCSLPPQKLLSRAVTATGIPAIEKAAENGNVDARALHCISQNAACAAGTSEQIAEGRAFTACERAGKAGNLRAVFNQGWMKQRGCGVPMDPAGALVAYNTASDAGCAIAQFTLAGLYNDAELVPYDQAKSISLLTKAAEQDFPPAMNRLANAYALGRGVPEDDTKAADLWRRAADLGDASAALNYANALERGTGVPANKQGAIGYYQKAAALADDPEVKQQAEAALKRIAATSS